MRAGEIHVFVMWLSSRLRLGVFLRGLSHVERKASRTFMNLQAKIEYIVSRFCVRQLASRYLSVGRHEIGLRKTDLGQPHLGGFQGVGAHQLNISISHCVRGIAIAFTHKGRVGVDFEGHRHSPAATAAVARWLTGAERTLVESRQIWDCWTRKEALLKGLGLGLSGLASIPPLEHQANLASAGNALWTVESLSVAPDCSLACASERFRGRIRLSTFRSFKTINRSF